MALPWIPKIVYSGPGSPLVLTFPQEMWTPSAQGIGGSRVTGSGVAESFLVRRDQLCEVNLRYYESERQAVETFLAWASANASTPFDFYFDQNIAATKHTVYLQTPVPGSGKSVPTRHDFKQVYREQLMLRSAVGSPFTILFFVGVDPAVALSIMPAPIIGLQGGSQALTITVVDATGAILTGRTFTFTSSNTSVAGVDANGLVTFLGAGSALITVVSGAVSSSTTATVTAPAGQVVGTVTVTPNPFTVAPGATLQLAAAIYDTNGVLMTGQAVTWSSSDTSKATVDKTGVVTGIGTGGSQSSAAVSDRQPTSPHYPDWNQKYTDFYYGWTTAERAWAASHHDSQMSGNANAFLSLNPTGKHSKYSLIWTTISNGAGTPDTNSSYFTSMAAWYADPTKNTTGGIFEHGFLHYKTGQTKYGTGKAITAVTATNPAVLTVAAHGMTSGQNTEVTGSTARGITDGNYIATVIDANMLSIPILATSAGTGGTISNQLGDGTLTPGNRKATTIWSSPRWPMNPGDAALRAYQVYRATLIAAAPELGIFWDEFDSADLGNSYLSVEYPVANTVGNGGPYNNGRGQNLTDWQTCLTAIKTAISPKEQWINPAAYFNFADDTNNVVAAGFGHFEQTLRADWSNDTGQLANYQAIVALASHPGFEMVSSYTWTDTVPNANFATAGSSGAFTTKTHREKGSCFVQTLLVYPAPALDPYFRRVYTDLNNFWNIPPSTAFLPFWERGHGRPVTPTFGVDAGRRILAPPTTNANYWTYDNTSVDSNAATVSILARETDQALLLYRHFAVGPADFAATINLPSTLTLSLLKEDGTLGPTITSVALCGGEGVVLIKTTAPISGSFTITASAGGRNGSAAGTVGAQTVATVTLAPSVQQNLAVGATVTIVATAKDGSGVTMAGAVFSWSSSAPSIASVSSAGVVTGVAAGNAVITASSQGHSATVPVSVSAAGRTITTITVAPASATLQVGSTQALVASVFDQFAVQIVGQAVTWSSGNAGIASVNSSSGVVTAVAVGSATITAAAGSATGTAAFTIQTVGGGLNEPSGMTAIFTRTFDAKNENGFTDFGTIDTTHFIVPITNAADAAIGTPPTSGPNVLKLFYPGGAGRGTLGSTYTPGNQTLIFYPHPNKQIYARFVLKLSTAASSTTAGYWSNHSSGWNRLGLLYLGGNFVASLIMAGVDGTAASEMFPSIIVSGYPTPDAAYNNRALPANVSSTAFITRGLWHTLEYRIVCNTPGVKDGIAETWVDGVKVVRVTDVAWVSSGQDQTCAEFDLTPRWGGTNIAQDIAAAIPDASIYMDNLYLSGKAALTP